MQKLMKCLTFWQNVLSSGKIVFRKSPPKSSFWILNVAMHFHGNHTLGLTVRQHYHILQRYRLGYVLIGNHGLSKFLMHGMKSHAMLLLCYRNFRNWKKIQSPLKFLNKYNLNDNISRRYEGNKQTIQHIM